MATIVGGLRLSLIQEAFRSLIEDGLDKIGWLTPNPGVRQDVKLLLEQLDVSEKIEPNTLGISFEDTSSNPAETGSILTVENMYAYVDIFAENEFVGQQLAGDVRDILRGKFASHGRSGPEFEVFTPDGELMAVCDMESIEMSRVREFDKPFKRYWWVVGAVIIDNYYDDLN